MNLYEKCDIIKETGAGLDIIVEMETNGLSGQKLFILLDNARIYRVTCCPNIHAMLNTAKRQMEQELNNIKDGIKMNGGTSSHSNTSIK